jgi:hypothetical protein
MRQRLLLVGLLVSAAVAVPAWGPSAEIKKGPLAAGKNIPGSFHPYNVTARVIPPEEMERKEEADKEKEKEKEPDKEKKADTTQGKYHCLVTEYDLDPVVILFAHGLEKDAAFGKLLQQLDAACTKHRADRLRAFVVFLFDDLTNVAAQDDQRAKAIKTVENVQNALKLSNVVLTIAARNDLAKYELDDTVALTVVMYRNLRIQASRTVSRDELDKENSPAIKAILADVSGKLLPRR